MTATINAAPLLDPDSLEFAAFEKIRRIGAERADGATFFHEGIEYGLTVDIPCRLELSHVVVECLSGPATGYQKAMAILYSRSQDRHDVDGLGLLINALSKGATINDATRPQNLSWRVLPWLPVPSCFVNSEASSGDNREG